MSLFKQSNGAAGYLNPEAFAAAVGDLDGGELSALDPVQDGLAGDAERFGGGVERQVAVRDEAGADLVSGGFAPGCVRGGLLAGKHAGFEPEADCAVGDAELDRGLLDRNRSLAGSGDGAAGI